MKASRDFAICCLLAFIAFAVVGCGPAKQEADENKPISEVKAEAAKMNTSQLRGMALAYKEAITAKTSEVDKVASKIKDMPVGEMLGDEMKKLKADLDALNKSISALQERYKIYYDKLKEKGGNLSGLES
jgi:polyhydroxyalkanoate synthesis regulator phasin